MQAERRFAAAPAERRFAAMGTSATVVVLGDDAVARAARAEARIAQLEARWSRFRPTSELSRLNASPRGCPVAVSADTYRLIDNAVTAWFATAGRYDPTVLPAMLANGYDRPFSESLDGFEVEAADEGAFSTERYAPGCLGIVLDPAAGTVELPEGTWLDPGGIGKGLAADLVATELLEAGATGVMVDLGGDIRLAGDGPGDGGTWIIDIDDPLGAERPLAHLALRNCGIATSSTLHRRWSTDDGPRHHLVDPATGRSLAGPFVAATAIAGTTWWAEAMTKASLVAGGVDEATDAAVVLVDFGGGRTATAGLQPLLA